MAKKPKLKKTSQITSELIKSKKINETKKELNRLNFKNLDECEVFIEKIRKMFPEVNQFLTPMEIIEAAGMGEVIFGNDDDCRTCLTCEKCESCVACQSCDSCQSCQKCESCVICQTCESCVTCQKEFMPSTERPTQMTDLEKIAFYNRENTVKSQLIQIINRLSMYPNFKKL